MFSRSAESELRLNEPLKRRHFSGSMFRKAFPVPTMISSCNSSPLVAICAVGSQEDRHSIGIDEGEG